MNDKTLNYIPASDEMILTVHCWFANKSCPGDWLYARLGGLAAKMTAALGGAAFGTSGGTASGSTLYRVRKTWADCKSQLGAYKVLKNAKAEADANPGYSVFDADGNVVYAGKTSSGDASSGRSLPGACLRQQLEHPHQFRHGLPEDRPVYRHRHIPYHSGIRRTRGIQMG